jgi:hypothetical protein
MDPDTADTFRTIFEGECAACGGAVELAPDGKVTIDCIHAMRHVGGECEVIRTMADVGLRLVDGYMKRDS